MAGSVDTIGKLQIISAWLHNRIGSQVGRFTVLHWVDIYRLEFDSTALTHGSMDPIEMFQGFLSGCAALVRSW